MKSATLIFKMLSIIAYLLFASKSIAQDNFEINGTVLDQNTNKPIPYANVYIKETFIGTVSNTSGEFTILVPKRHTDKVLVISSIGYQSSNNIISDINLDAQELIVELKTSPYVLNEVVVTNCELILSEAMERIPDNYPIEFTSLTSFYREVIKKNKSYVDVSQGVLRIAKAPYIQDRKEIRKDQDQVSLHKGHRVTNYSKNDTLAFKVKGGPNMMMMLDIVKRPGVVLGSRYKGYYQYTFEGIQIIDGRRSYVLSFEPKPGIETSVYLYAGTIYIDEKTFAVAGLSFGFQEESLKGVVNNMIEQKPSLAQIHLQKMNYEVRYRQSGEKWFLDYVRNEIEVKINWKRRLFNSKFNATTELVITDKIPFESNETESRQLLVTSKKDLFSDQILDLYETQYWEDFSIIRPEEDLKKAIERINK